MSKKLNILLICDYYRGCAGTIKEHIFAFKKYSQHNVYILNNRGNLPPSINLALYDVVVIHYSIIICNDSYLNASARERIRHFSGMKVLFIQDDYRWINATFSALDYMRISIIFGLASKEVQDAMYPDKKLSTPLCKKTVLPGYVETRLLKLKPKKHSERTCHIGYRARKLSAWIGKHAQQKYLIAEKVQTDLQNRNELRTDISCREEDRLYGKAWINFLLNCRAVLGTESGSSVCDFTGDIQKNVEEHEQRDPNVTFNELSELYFKDVDGKYVINVISPRAFEAAALKCLMILYEGEYSGILKPYRHYLPLRRDHSNLNEIVDLLHDESNYLDIVENAYNEIALNPEYRYPAMINKFDHALNEVCAIANNGSAKLGFLKTVTHKKLLTYLGVVSKYRNHLNIFELKAHVLLANTRNRLLYWIAVSTMCFITLVVPKKYSQQVIDFLKKIYYRDKGPFS